MSQDDSQAGKGFSLVMTLKDVTRVGASRAWLSQPDTWKAIYQGLAKIDALHYARFLPLEQEGKILFIAEYDGPLGDFVGALATHLSEPFKQLLESMEDAPENAFGDGGAGFAAYVERHRARDMSVFSAYQDRTAKDIAGAAPPAEPPQLIELDPDATKCVGGAFNLVMKLREPARILELLSSLVDPYTKGRIDKALASLDYVHYARFLPLPESGVLMILTEFDGVMRDYVMDFAAALDREFSLILSCMEGGPRLPVSQHPAEFWNYVKSHLVKDTGLYSAYPGKTVLDIVGATKAKFLPEQPKVPPANVDLSDVQANVLRGFRPARAYHYFLRFTDPARGREFLRTFPVTRASDKPQDDSACLNIGLTHAGLVALEVPDYLHTSFPVAFQQGPAKRNILTGDVGHNDPKNWQVGAEEKAEEQVHAVVSVLCRPNAKDDYARKTVENLMALHGVRAVLGQSAELLYARKAEAFADAPNEIHFGYRDGIAQPLIAGVHDPVETAREPNAVPGDFLLGHDYVNSRGGRYIGSLYEPMVLNGTYAAFRIIEQHVAVFDTWLQDTATAHSLDADFLAAKLMGRWKDGTPVTQFDEALGSKAAETPLDDFDYVGPRGGNDALGLRCPIGAHIRRFNPRAGMVLGVPWGRQILRRGLPFGPRREAGPGKSDDNVSRGLVGMFMCGDLEAQFEFLLHVWGRNDLSAFGLRDTQDPFTSGGETTFRFALKEKETVRLTVPPLTQTLGSLYLFMPGIKALNWIGQGKWPIPRPPANPQPPAAPVHASRPSFNPKEHQDFHINPYRHYSRLRNSTPVLRVEGNYDSYWVLSHELVTEVCRPENQNLFQKPGKNRLKQDLPFGIDGDTSDGLFFMDPPRHTEVRPELDDVFKAAIAPLLGRLSAKADEIAGQLLKNAPLEVVTSYAALIAPWAFEEAFGFRSGTAERFMVEKWTRAMLAGRDPNEDPMVRIEGGTSGLALRGYLSGLTRDQVLPPGGCKAPWTTILSGLHKLSKCPVLHTPLTGDEVTNTASHFALGGYLSTEFLIITGIYNLVRHPKQWTALRDNPDPKVIMDAVWEMLRYDAPFQMADRWVARDCYLGGVPLPADSKLTVVYGSANHDENVFERPDEFDISRPYDREKIYGFGHGIHRCIGEELAMAVAAAAIGAILKVFKDPTVVSGGDSWLSDPYFRSLKELKIV